MTDQAAFFAKLHQQFESYPFGRHLGLKVDEIRDGFARMSLPFKAEHIGDTERPAQHGGILLAMGDQCGALAIWSKLGPAARLSTIDFRMDFLKPAPPETLLMESRALRVGNRVGVSELRALCASRPDEVLAVGVGVYNIAEPSSRT